MQYLLRIFETEDHADFRVVDQDGEPWFVLADVCRALDLKPHRGSFGHHADKLDSDDRQSVARADIVRATTSRSDMGATVSGGSLTIINESGLCDVTPETSSR